MPRLLSSAALAVFAILVAAGPSAAYGTCATPVSYQLASDGYGRVPTCVVKKVRGYDSYGNPVTKKVRVCR